MGFSEVARKDLEQIAGTNDFFCRGKLFPWIGFRARQAIASPLLAKDDGGISTAVLGWFTQIGAVAAAMSGFFGVAAEPPLHVPHAVGSHLPEHRSCGTHLGALRACQPAQGGRGKRTRRKRRWL